MRSSFASRAAWSRSRWVFAIPALYPAAKRASAGHRSAWRGPQDRPPPVEPHGEMIGLRREQEERVRVLVPRVATLEATVVRTVPDAAELALTATPDVPL